MTLPTFSYSMLDMLTAYAGSFVLRLPCAANEVRSLYPLKGGGSDSVTPQPESKPLYEFVTGGALFCEIAKATCGARRPATAIRRWERGLRIAIETLRENTPADGLYFVYTGGQALVTPDERWYAIPILAALVRPIRGDRP